MDRNLNTGSNININKSKAKNSIEKNIQSIQK